jgi:hypothetical protein
MAKKRTTAKAKRTSKPQSAESKTQAKRPGVKHKDDGDRGAPIEHFHGEPNRANQIDQPGSLDQETLDRDAPYNKTYGR